jgi:hypothetical protein
MMEEKDHDVITTLQVDGLAQFFAPQDSESRTTPFQEGEDDDDIPAHHMLEHEEHSLSNTNEWILGRIDRPR